MQVSQLLFLWCSHIETQLIFVHEVFPTPGSYSLRGVRAVMDLLRVEGPGEAEEWRF